MLLYLLNESFEKIGIIDSYVSIIWTTRYQDVGEFELYLPSNNPNTFKCGQFLQRDDDKTVMIIESIQFTSDEEAGDFCTLTGKSIEQILSRRIIWDKTQLIGNIEESMYRIVDENAVNTDDERRKIPNMKCAKLKGFSSSGTFVYHGESLLDVITTLCQSYDIGFKVTYNNGEMIFEIYQGTDRSYNQTNNPFVIFSPDFDNLLNSTYRRETANYKNVCLVYSETQRTASGHATQAVGTGFGLNRRETFVDAGNEDTGEDYWERLISKGREVLSETTLTETFEAEIEPTYKYGEDYFLGDIVQLENEYGVKATARIMEIIENEDESGYTCIPTFKTLEV